MERKNLYIIPAIAMLIFYPVLCSARDHIMRGFQAELCLTQMHIASYVFILIIAAYCLLFQMLLSKASKEDDKITLVVTILIMVLYIVAPFFLTLGSVQGNIFVDFAMTMVNPVYQIVPLIIIMHAIIRHV